MLIETKAALRSILDILEPEARKSVIRQIAQEQGVIQTDVPRMYSDKEIAERYGVHVRTAREWIINGKLRGCKIERYWYSRADWLDEFDRAHEEMRPAQ